MTFKLNYFDIKITLNFDKYQIAQQVFKFHRTLKVKRAKLDN